MSDAILVMYSNLRPTRGHVERLRTLGGPRPVVVADSEAEALEAAGEAAVFLGHRYFRQCLPHAPRLRWVQSTAAGVDALVHDELFERDLLVSRCPIFGRTVAWHAVAMALALMRRLPDAARRQPERDWSWSLPFASAPRRAVVLGLGAIGLEAARLLGALGLAVTGVCRRRSAERAAACDELLTDGSWRGRLAEADAVVLALPATRETRRIFDARAIDALPAHAVLVDVGRPGTLDVPHALRHLAAGGLLGLGLDTVDLDHFGKTPDWSTPGLLVTPKVSTFRAGRQSELEAFMETQLQRYLAGDEPHYLVSRDALKEMLGASTGGSE